LSGFVIDPSVYDAPAANPLARVTNTVKVTINNAQVSQINYQCVPAFANMNISDMQISKDLSLCPSMLDNFQNYSDAQQMTINTVTGVFQNGTVLDPLQPQGASMFPTRGGWPMTIVSNPQPGTGQSGTAVVQFTTCESLWLSPFQNTQDSNALYGVQTMVLSFVFNNLARVWSHSTNSNASAVTAVTAVFTQPPEIHLNFVSPSLTDNIPKQLVYNYSNVDVYQTDDNTNRAPGALWTYSSSNIQFNVIPKRIVIFARPTDTYINSSPSNMVTTTDTFASILSISCNFDNTSGKDCPIVVCG
jgi:hypothetical protein